MYETLAEVHCSCCMEGHTLRFDLCKDYHNDTEHEALYIVIKDHGKYTLTERLKRAFYFIRKWKDYIDGENITSHGVLMHGEQLTELYPILKDKLLEYKIIDDEDLAFIEGDSEIDLLSKTVPATFKDRKGKKTIHQEPVPFIGDDFVLALDIFFAESIDKHLLRDITFGYKLNEHYTKRDAWRMAFYHILYNSNNFIGGDYEGFMSKDNTVKLLRIFYHLIQNIE